MRLYDKFILYLVKSQSLRILYLADLLNRLPNSDKCWVLSEADRIQRSILLILDSEGR